jgi:hypothetical protein
MLLFRPSKLRTGLDSMKVIGDLDKGNGDKNLFGVD